MSIYDEKIVSLAFECKIHEARSRKHAIVSSKITNNNEARENGKTGKKIECNFSRYRNENSTANSNNADSHETLSKEVEDFVWRSKFRTASNEFCSLSKMMALSCLAAGNEISAIRYLIESHAVILQQHIYFRYMKTLVRQKYLTQDLESGLRPIRMNFDPKSQEPNDPLREKLGQMPQEWYMVQVTSGYKQLDSSSSNDSVLDKTHPLYITVLPTGKDGIEPFCVVVPRLSYGKDWKYDALKEIVEIQRNNKSQLQAYYATNKSYWKMRENQNNRMKTAMKELEHSWFREWRILLIADPLEDSSQVKEIRGMIDKLIADDLSVIDISPRTRWLLKKIATSSSFLTKLEIARAVRYVLGEKEKLAKNVILSIHGMLGSVDALRTEKRKTLVLIVDECIDHIPFESMDVLKTHPTTRFPSFHIAYAMFKEHEDTIVKGCKIIKNTEKLGTFIVNPAGNLDKMEKRMLLFIDYWLPQWKGIYGRKPDEEIFEKVLVDKDVLMYSGHGSGIQYLPGEKIERLRVRATVLLFGCSSVKLNSIGGRFPPYGVSNQYLIACSPCVLGMLWEVTDGDIDRLTARFMSDWIPSDTEKPWSSVNVDRWCNGVLKFKTSSEKDSSAKSAREPELLRAVANSKEVCTQHMTSAAVIVRGLPIRLE